MPGSVSGSQPTDPPRNTRCLPSAAPVGLLVGDGLRAFDERSLTTVGEMPRWNFSGIGFATAPAKADFARYFIVTTNLVSQWARGEKRPHRFANTTDTECEERFGRSGVTARTAGVRRQADRSAAGCESRQVSK